MQLAPDTGQDCRFLPTPAEVNSTARPAAPSDVDSTAAVRHKTALGRKTVALLLFFQPVVSIRHRALGHEPERPHANEYRSCEYRIRWSSLSGMTETQRNVVELPRTNDVGNPGHTWANPYVFGTGPAR
jgi:hypothetical protein